MIQWMRNAMELVLKGYLVAKELKFQDGRQF